MGGPCTTLRSNEAVVPLPPRLPQGRRLHRPLHRPLVPAAIPVIRAALRAMSAAGRVVTTLLRVLIANEGVPADMERCTIASGMITDVLLVIK